MRAWALAVSGLALFAACHSYRAESKRPANPLPVRPGVSAALPTVEYMPAEELLRNMRHLAPTPKNPDGGVIVSGLRIDAQGRLAPDLGNPPLSGGTRIPSFQGGGFLFWSHRALYSAKSFVAPLEPMFAVSSATSPSRVSFGNGVALLHANDGGRVAFNLTTRRRVAMPTPGLIDMVALTDGRAVMLSEPNRILTLPAGRANAWKDQTDQAGSVRDLFVEDDSIWVKRTSNEMLRLEADGRLIELSSVPEIVQKRARGPERDPRWPNSISESPMKRAVRRGVLIDASTALVEAAGRFARIDVRTGQIGQIGPSILTSGADCELVPVAGDVLAACRNSNGTSAVIAGAAAQPEIEKVFATNAVFFNGADGLLAFGGPCGDVAKAPRWAVCVRQGPGLWRELSSQPHADKTDPWIADGGSDGGAPRAPIVVTRWIPTKDGALGLVGGDQGGIVDAVHGTFTPFSNEGYKTAAGLFNASSGTVVDSMIVDSDGSIVGYTDRESLRLGRDGTITRSPFTFERLSSSGANALASDRDGRLWQSVDYGRTFVEVARPPGTQAGAHVGIQLCSRAGCDLGQWYRIGFRATPPTLEKRPEAPPAASSSALPAARLVCEKTAPPETRWATRARNASGALTEEFDLGAKKFPVKNEGEVGLLSFNYGGGAESLLRAATPIDPALADQTGAGFGRALGQPRTLRLVEPLGDAKVGESRFNWQDVIRAAIAQGTQNPNAPSSDARVAVPVLGQKPASSEGLLLIDPSGPFIWARAGKPSVVLAFGPESEGYAPVSALIRGKDELVVLAVSGDCALRVFSFAGGRGARVLSELPPRPGAQHCPVNGDSLALLPDGSLAVVRIPSRDAPSADDPALLLKPGQPPVALAPWTTLASADSCATDAAAARALVLVGSPWIKLEAPGIDASDDAFLLAVVRWSSTLACVEAVEVGGGTITIGEQELPTSVLARFAPAPSALRRGYAPGGETSEPLACKLVR